ncbi:MAG TPA: DUF4347 domain-containing protein [Steroidobacteraceae bacterium]|nr:DUF4347 domain-containing protein [Steroidobacteraceae bacterium]
MIRMIEPSLVINTHDVPGPLYKMWQTVSAAPGANIGMLLQYIDDAQRVSLETFGYRLINIVINSHGGPGRLYLGGLHYRAIDKSDLPMLAPLRGSSSGTIWIVACEIAAGSAGQNFCQTLAMTTGYQVVAGTVEQEVGFSDGYKMLYIKNTIDEFEGDVFAFYASGSSRQIDPHTDVFTIYD